MTKLGYTMITLGFLAASYAAVLHPTEINWTLFVPLGLVSVIGVVVVRRSAAAKAQHADTIAANIEDIETSLTRISANVTKLNREKEMIHTYDMRHKLDELLLDDFDTFVNARETIGIKYGLHEYADIMSHYAAGERYVNRVWSCSADGYIDEVNAYIAKAEEQFNAALEKFKTLKASKP